jgi:hypothetical protein
MLVRDRGVETVNRAVTRLDAWRRPLTGPASEPGSFKEWMHFCIRLPDGGHLLANLNVTERRLPGGVVRTPRLIALCHSGEWRGEVQGFTAGEVRGAAGVVDVRMGDNRLRWSKGAFRLQLASGDLTADLELRPMVLPTVTSSVSFGPGHSMHWVVIPRLDAHGTVVVAGRRIDVHGALAYHDHNWGHFRWGGDLSWEWGFVNPADPGCPWSAVFVRVSDGARHRTLSQGVLLWKYDVNVRTFQNREIAMRLDGVHVGARPLTLPHIAGLLVPGASSGVPARLHIDAAGTGEQLGLDFEVTSKARIVVPSDSDEFRAVLLNETTGPARVHGETHAGRFDFQGPAIVEFVRG